ncbi:cilia- and flagella-associated protein 418-like isoform X2 [Hydra vulgaris]|uniref:Cilia- and flagella-associated protein 418 n=1 Tax=Hydra vulgaris TaxID=6087 RepID=A0ABM4DP75_HYDVU
MKNFEQIVQKMLDEQKVIILKEAERLLNIQEKNFLAMTISNMKTITDRLDSIENEKVNIKKKIIAMQKDIDNIKESLNSQVEIFVGKLSELNKHIETELKHKDDKKKFESKKTVKVLKIFNKNFCNIEKYLSSITGVLIYERFANETEEFQDRVGNDVEELHVEDQMDEIDGLLDEVEQKYCSKEENTLNKNRTKLPLQKETNVLTLNVPRSKQSELDDIVNEIMNDDSLEKSYKNNSRRSSSQSQSSSSSQEESKLKIKCSEIFIGGTQAQFGAASHFYKRVCNQIHCLSCDNRVVYFDNYEWNEESCDYLVFRNNYPDFSRLKFVLHPRNGFRAYCCQCSWLYVKEPIELEKCKPNFKWICKKHNR